MGDFYLTKLFSNKKSINTLILMIHSNGAVLPDYTKKYYDQIASQDKNLYWIETNLDSPFHQFNFYDQKNEVNEVITQAEKWLNRM